jgi:hypothetical protein
MQDSIVAPSVIFDERELSDSLREIQRSTQFRGAEVDVLMRELTSERAAVQTHMSTLRHARTQPSAFVSAVAVECDEWLCGVCVCHN